MQVQWAPFQVAHLQSSRKSVKVYRTESYKMIKMYLIIQDIFTRPNEFLPDMSGGQTEFPEDWACCTHGRPPTRSPGVSIMKDDSRELPLSAIPLCQLPLSHLGPPRPMLSINLYVKGCLDCTVGAFQVSIPQCSAEKFHN